MKTVSVPNWFLEHIDYYDDKRDYNNVWEEECKELIEEDEDE